MGTDLDFARIPNDDEGLGDGNRGQDLAPAYLAWCTAGWDNEATVEDLSGPVCCARVTLYEGKQLGIPTTTGSAQGHEVIVSIPGPLFAIPPKGTRVLCAFPNGDTATHGNGAIICWGQANPTSQFAASTPVLQPPAGSTLILGFAGGTQISIVNGSVIVTSGSGTVTIVGNTVNVGSASPSDAAALASKVDGNTSNLSSFLTQLQTIIDALGLATVGGAPTPTTAFDTALGSFKSSLQNSASASVKITP